MEKTFNPQHVGKQVKVIAAVWKDKKHRLVVATCGTNRLLHARERVKVKYKGGQIVSSSYDVELTKLHGIYNHNFSDVDIHNKLSIGLGSIADAWKCKEPLLRFFLHTLIMIGRPPAAQRRRPRRGERSHARRHLPPPPRGGRW
jgi:hypothetical protein